MISDWKDTPYTGIYILPNLGNVVHLESGQWAWTTICYGWLDGVSPTKQKAIEACENALKRDKGHDKI